MLQTILSTVLPEGGSTKGQVTAVREDIAINLNYSSMNKQLQQTYSNQHKHELGEGVVS